MRHSLSLLSVFMAEGRLTRSFLCFSTYHSVTQSDEDTANNCLYLSGCVVTTGVIVVNVTVGWSDGNISTDIKTIYFPGWR